MNKPVIGLALGSGSARGWAHIGEPPEVVVAPRLAHLRLLDFHRAREAIDAGRQAAEASLPLLRQLGL